MDEPNLFVFDDNLELEVDRLFANATVVQIIEKGVGFCLSVPCSEYLQGKFLYRWEGPFICQSCNCTGRAVEEQGIPARKAGQLYGEVRVEYNYCPAQDRYLEIGIVRDEALGDDIGVYTAQMPTIHTERRALATAEMLLVTLNNELPIQDPRVVPQVRERCLVLDKPIEEVRDWLRKFELQVQGNSFYRVRE